jgi:hypothetical protein
MSAPSTAFVQQYKDAIYLLAQQMDVRLRPAVVNDNDFVGEAKYYDQYATDSMIEILSRYADTPVQLPDHRRRVVYPRFFVSNTLEDPQDALAMLIDPKSAYMQAKIAAAGRQQDDIIISAAGGTAYQGKAGGSQATLAAANKVAYNFGGVSSGCTKLKCIDAKKILDSFEVDKTDRFAWATSSQLADLLNTTEVTSADYNVVRSLVQGEINTWLGFIWIQTERLTTGSYGRYMYFMQKKGMLFAVQKEMEGRVDERKDKNYAWQVYLRMCCGSTRLEENRVVQAECVETF